MIYASKTQSLKVKPRKKRAAHYLWRSEQKQISRYDGVEMNSNSSQPQPHFFIRDFVAGGLSSILSDTIVAPLERIKLILQVQAISPQIKEDERYKGLMDALKRIPQEQGFYSLWRGNTVSVIRSFPIQAFNFAFKDRLKYYFLDDVDVRSEHFKVVVANFAAGGIAGVLSISIVYPLDLARTKMAADVGVGGLRALYSPSLKERQFTGVIDCLKKTSSSHGYRGLYQGYGISIIGIFIYRACYFGFYDTMKIVFSDDVPETEIPFYQKWLMAQSTVAVAGLISYPFDSIRRRMMMQAGLSTKERKYTNLKECIRKTLREEGFSSLYRGSLINLLSSTGGALILILYDEIIQQFNKKFVAV